MTDRILIEETGFQSSLMRSCIWNAVWYPRPLLLLKLFGDLRKNHSHWRKQDFLRKVHTIIFLPHGFFYFKYFFFLLQMSPTNPTALSETMGLVQQRSLQRSSLFSVVRPHSGWRSSLGACLQSCLASSLLSGPIFILRFFWWVHFFW